jgi:ribonuclease P protein component
LKHFSLSAKERIKSKKIFDAIYTSGITIFSANKKFKASYLIEQKSKRPEVKMAAAVSKKSGNAVWRNRVKRLIKESYRLNKFGLINFAEEKKVTFNIVFSANALTEKKNKKPKLKDVMPDIIELIMRLKGSL